MQFNTSTPQAESGGVHTRIDGPAGPFYRRILTMELETFGQPDAIEIDEATLQFSAAFTPETYDVLENGGPIPVAASEQKNDYTVVFRLDRPRKIKTIHLTSNDGYHFAHNGNAMAAVDAVVAVWACAARPVDINIHKDHDIAGMAAGHITGYNNLQLFRMDGDAIADEPTVTAQSGSNLADAFIVQDFAVTRQNMDGTPAPLSVEDVLSIKIESLPTGPRIGLPESIDTDPSKAGVYFWQIPGEVTETDAYDTANDTAGNTFKNSLQRYLDSWLAQLDADTVPENLTIPLLIDSDAPCHNELTVSFDYFLVRQGFPTGEDSPQSREKRVLKFDGKPGQTHAIMVRVPKNSTISSASLKMDVSFGAPPPTPVSGVPPMETVSGKGIHLSVNRWAAQPVMVTDALTLTGISIGVMGIEKNTRLSVSLRGDNQGRPDGQKLGQQEVSLTTAGRRQYIQVPFNDVISLTKPENWLLVKALHGTAVWLTDDDSQNQMILTQVTTSGGVSQKRTSLNGVRGLYTFFSRSINRSQNPFPLSITAGNTSVSLEKAEGSLLQTAAPLFKNGLNSCIESPTSDCIVNADSIDIPLFFTANVKGMATVYTPTLKYEFLYDSSEY